MRPTATQDIFDQFYSQITSGRWSIGNAIPSERDLIQEYGISRIAVREAISMLRGLGVLDVGHGRRTVVRKLDSSLLNQLFPLMLSSGGQQTFDQIFDVRIALESHAASLAALHCTEAEANNITQLAALYRKQTTAKAKQAFDTDLEFHLAIAKASKNPLFASILEALLGFVSFAQIESCKNDSKRSQRAIVAHENIAEAIAERNAERAKVEMESHLRYSATRKLATK